MTDLSFLEVITFKEGTAASTRVLLSPSIRQVNCQYRQLPIQSMARSETHRHLLFILLIERIWRPSTTEPPSTLIHSTFYSPAKLPLSHCLFFLLFLSQTCVTSGNSFVVSHACGSSAETKAAAVAAIVVRGHCRRQTNCRVRIIRQHTVKTKVEQRTEKVEQKSVNEKEQE